VDALENSNNLGVVLKPQNYNLLGVTKAKKTVKDASELGVKLSEKFTDKYI